MPNIINFNRLSLSIFIFGMIFFTSTSVASATSVSLSPSSSSTAIGSQFTVAINIGAVTNLFGVAFDLIYDPAVIQFISAQKGSLLEQDGATTVMTTAVSPAGDLIVGYSRQAVNGVATGITGSGTLMTLTFEGLLSGTSSLVFQNNALCDPTNTSCGIITATWNNGSATVSSTDITPPAAPTGLSVS